MGSFHFRRQCVILSRSLRRLATALLLIIMMNTMFLIFTIVVPSRLMIVNEKERFPVYWNVPSQRCFEKGIKIPLEQYGINFNEEQKFFGDQIVIFYEYTFGTFPYFNSSNASEPVHGGLPQLCNVAKHLEVVRENITTRIPDESFEGVAVIDFEEWRPLFHLNWAAKRVYQKESIRLVKKREPTLSDKAAKLLAQLEFNMAAKKIFLETIKLCRQLRPNAKWGFYGFPLCNYSAGQKGEAVCSKVFQDYNNELLFVISAGSALFPSIYFREHEPRNLRYVQAIMGESRRVAALALNPLSVYPYTKFEYNPFDVKREVVFYVKRDMCNSAKQAADHGASGLILWSTSYQMWDARCRSIQNFVERKLGPVISLLRHRVTKCSKKRCGGKGRCVLKEPSERCQFQMKPDIYRCECDPQFAGSSCEQHTHLPWLFSFENQFEEEEVFE